MKLIYLIRGNEFKIEPTKREDSKKKQART